MAKTKNFVTPLKQANENQVNSGFVTEKQIILPGPLTALPRPPDVLPEPPDVPPQPPAVPPGPSAGPPGPSLAPSLKILPDMATSPHFAGKTEPPTRSKHRILARKPETVADHVTVQTSVSCLTPVHPALQEPETSIPAKLAVPGKQAGPKKPNSPFLMFIRKERQKLVKLGLSEEELHKKLMQNWININPVLKQKLESLYAKNKEKYGINLGIFEQKQMNAAAKKSQSTSTKKKVEKKGKTNGGTWTQ